ncbi:MAG: response regulator [Proteobacteria bacterium]|nr:response regulator [Pseudomonadota bacterium]
MSGQEIASLNVMTVEDEAFSQQVIAKVLEEVGVASVTVAGNGAEALDKLAGADSKIHFIVCDIEMPEMGGYEFIRQVCYGAVPGCKDIPIIMLTGKDTDKNAQKARIHKISGFLVKPAKPNTLTNAIRHALGR